MAEGLAPVSKLVGMKVMAFILARPALYRFGGAFFRCFSTLLNNRFNPWYKQREMPLAPKESFQDWYKKR